ncbi:hypothetical protein ACQJBY_009353 [Aegilops geniculata]
MYIQLYCGHVRAMRQIKARVVRSKLRILSKLKVYVQFSQYQLSPGTRQFAQLEDGTVSVQKAAGAEVQIQRYAKMLHLRIGIVHQVQHGLYFRATLGCM